MSELLIAGIVVAIVLVSGFLAALGAFNDFCDRLIYRG